MTTFLDQFVSRFAPAALEVKHRAFLMDPHPAVLAWISPRDQPRSAAVWYLFHESAFWIWVELASAKVTAIARRPDISLTIEDQSVSRGLTIHGRAELEPYDPDLHHLLETRYLGPHPTIQEPPLAEAQKVAGFLRITPQRVLWFDYTGKEGRGATWLHLRRFRNTGGLVRGNRMDRNTDR